MFQGPQWGRTSLVLYLLYTCLSLRFRGLSEGERLSSWTERFWQCFSPLCFRGHSEGEWLKLNRKFLTVFLPIMFQGPQWGRAAQAEQNIFDSVSPCYVSGLLSEGERLKLNRTFLTAFLPVMFQGPQWGRAAQAEQNIFDSISPCYVSRASVRENISSALPALHMSLITFQGPQWGRTSLVLYLLYTCLSLHFRGLSEGEHL